MTHPFNTFVLLLAATFAAASSAGCGGGGTPKKSNDFFTSGNAEADQRADQRMAKTEQIRGSGNGGKAGAAGQAAARTDQKKSLYDRLGGERGLTIIVDDFTARALADPRVNWQRKGVKRGGLTIHRNQPVTWDANDDNVRKLKVHLVEFLSIATGGPAKYDGKEIKGTHAGMHISNPEFDASVGDMKATLDKLEVLNKEQKELLAVLESTRPEIVEQR